MYRPSKSKKLPFEKVTTEQRGVIERQRRLSHPIFDDRVICAILMLHQGIEPVTIQELHGAAVLQEALQRFRQVWKAIPVITASEHESK